MDQKNMGHVVDIDGLEIEVYVSEEHVFLLFGGSQIGDFPLGMPRDCEVERLAQRVATGESKRLACMGPDAVIDDNDDCGQGRTNHTASKSHTVH